MYKEILDPKADREAAKYSNPIPSREYILSLLQKSEQSLTRQRLSNLLMLTDEKQQEALRRRLRAMCRDGQLIWSSRKGYQLTQHAVFLKGKIIGNRDTFGFVTPDDKSPDVFLSASQMRQVFPNDRVLVRVIREVRKGRREAIIVEVLERNTTSLIGYYEQENGHATIKPTHSLIHHTVDIENIQPALKPGSVVLVEIIQQPTLYHSPKGRVIKVVGCKNTSGIESVIAIHTHQLPEEWSDEINNELTQLQNKSLPDGAARADLTHLPFVTIDGDDSKDFDDAVYCEPAKNGWRLLVAIADVSHYVKPDTAIDKAASLRGNSVYLPHQVVPMLPELLSNDVCSINPHVKRFCLACDMTISQQGQLLSYEFYPAVITSQARLSYSEVAEYLKGAYPFQSEQITLSLNNLKAIYEALLVAKQQRGAIDITIPESQMLLDTQGNLSNMQRRERTIAHRIIEECMLVANVAAAQFLLKHKVPSLFRVHGAPTRDKLEDFKNIVGSLGIKVDSRFQKETQTIDFARLIQETIEHPGAQLIQTMLLRTMNQAIYTAINTGHFGLAYPEYTHFTSPIRRYPDLLVHRAIYHVLNTKKQKKCFDYSTETLESLGQHCSTTERRADEATRQAAGMLKCRLMQGNLGKSFIGKITHVTGFGFFVVLEANLIEGLVHIHSIKDDYYIFEPRKMLLKGEHHGKTYRLGDTVRVQVTGVDVESTTIDFKLCD